MKSQSHYYNCHLQLNFDASTYGIVYLDIDPQELIKSSSFESNIGQEFDQLMDFLLSKINTQNIKSILSNEFLTKLQEQNQSSYFDWAYLLITKAIYNFKGSFNQVNDFKTICRCFGVDVDTICQTIKNGATLDETILQTSASTGCRSCYPQVIETFLSAHNESRRFRNISNSSWVLKCDELLHSFLASTPLDFSKSKFEITGFKAGILTGKSSDKAHFKSFKFAFEEFLEKEIKEKIIVWAL